MSEALAPVDQEIGDQEMLDHAAPEPLVETRELPGAQLKAAREALGFSVSDVSHALKFSVRQVEGLEQDDFSNLSGHTFLRGFVRSYARFLKLDEVPLLAALQQEIPAPVTEVREVESMNAAMPANTSPLTFQPVRLALRLLVVLAVVGGLVWFAIQSGWLRKHEGEVTPVAAQTDATAAEAVAPIAPVLQDSAPVLAPAPAVLAPGATPADAQLVPATAPATPVAADERVLSFVFADQSWVEVKDARQTIVLTGKYFAGAQQVARGKPPFQVVIGNANAVKLRYDDRAIDLTPFIRAEVARLTLDDNSK